MRACKLSPSPVELETLHIGQREILLGGLSTGTYGCTGTIKGVHSYQKMKWCLRDLGTWVPGLLHEETDMLSLFRWSQ